MKPHRFAACLLLPVLALLPSPARSTLPAGFSPPGIKVLVIRGKVALPRDFPPVRGWEGPVSLLDRSMRARGVLTQFDEKDLNELAATLRTGVYVVIPACRVQEYAPHAADEDWRTDTADIDGDGDMDIVTARYMMPARVLINTGGSFVDESERIPPFSGDASDIDLVDVNGDSLPDAFFSMNDEQNRMFINDGTGRFADSTFTHLPVDSSGSQSACWGDVDRDGDNDIFVANIGVPFDPLSEENQLLINDGRGHFTDQTHLRFQFTPKMDISLDCLAFDAEGDHDLDLVIIDDNTNGDRSRILINNGNGYFSDETVQRFPDVTGSCMRGCPADMDGDGKQDLYIANFFWELNFLWMNDGTGRFYDETQLRTPFSSAVDSGWSQGCDVADIEGDDDIDIVVGNLALGDSLYPGRGRNRLLVNEGSGFFTDRTFQIFPDREDTTVDVDFFDAGGGGYIDLYVTNLDEADVLMLDPGEHVGIAHEGPTSPPLPAAAFLEQNYPNPFNPQTTIRFSAPGNPGDLCPVSLAVYDLKGRFVRTLIDGRLPSGLHVVVWDGRDERGMKVASGVYLARMVVGGESTNIKMSLLK